MEIWIAQGTYHENITLKSSIRLYGSFKGIEKELHERDLDPNSLDPKTIIDGNQHGSVIVAFEVEDALIDGFTITNGSGVIWGEGSMGGSIFCYKLQAHVYQYTSIKNCW